MKVYFETGQDKGHDVRGIGVHTAELLKQLKKLQSINYRLQITTNKDEADIIHFTYFKPFEKTVVPFAKPADQKWILTIHDLIPLIYPRHYPPGIKGKLTFLSNKFVINKNVDAIITISETSKKDICRFLKINPQKVHVIYLAPKKIFEKRKVTKKYNLPKKFVLYDGDINFNKNIPNLIKACKLARLSLVIVGKHATEIENIDTQHAELTHLTGLDFTGVKRLGYVSDEELRDLFNLASVYVQPSFYEGFGLSVLEAVASGTPIAVSKTQALVEILGTGLKYFNPNEPKDIAKKILNPNRNVKLPRSYSWERCAQDTFSIYEKALKH